MLNPIDVIKSLEEICKIRSQVIGRFIASQELLGEARTLAESVNQHSWPYDATPRLSEKGFRQEVDRRFWRSCFDKTGLMQLMDTKARAEFNTSLDRDPPEFTEENARSALLSAAQDSEMMFSRGIVDFFSRLSQYHKTNTKEPFKISRKAILERVVDNWGGVMTVGCSSYGDGMGRFNDLDRVFKSLDGKKHFARELETRINAGWKESNVYEDDYFQVKGFKNGNAHILFKREDLLDKANHLIHAYFGDDCLGKG